MIKDLRDFIAKCEEINELKRVKTEVDWNLELSHISKLNEEIRGPALLFENVKGHKISVLSGALSTPKRLAVALGMPLEFSVCEMSRRWMELVTKEYIPSKEVSDGPVFENMIEGENVDLFSFPVPKFYPLDGGRYIGTAVTAITQDPDTGWTNLGTYRMQLLDKNHTAIQFVKGKHGGMMLDRCRELGKPMPMVAVIGQAPVNFLLSSTTAPAGVCEYDIAGAIQGKPVEVVKSGLTELIIPATAEIVLEGEINSDPESYVQEGPFGEYTGYYSGKDDEEWPKPCFEVKRVYHRNDPIFWVTSVGAPVTDTHMLGAVQVSGSLWADLEQMRVPGIQSVYCPPETTGRLWAIVSIKQMYPGHSTHVATAVAGCTSGHYRLKGIIVVDDDIPADDMSKIVWALSVRFDPERGTQVLKRTRGGPLDPGVAIENRGMGSKIILDACIPFEWERKPSKIELDEKTVELVRKRWKEYGL